jgi:hypothetical protein
MTLLMPNCYNFTLIQRKNKILDYYDCKILSRLAAQKEGIKAKYSLENESDYVFTFHSSNYILIRDIKQIVFVSFSGFYSIDMP